MSVHVVVAADVGGFAEDKDRAKRLRVERVLPALHAGEDVVLDFDGVEHVTQSFVHALVGEPLKKYGESVLERIEFKNCATTQVRTVIELVVDYSLGGFDFEPSSEQPTEAQRNGPKRGKTTNNA